MKGIYLLHGLSVTASATKKEKTENCDFLVS
jgi:hypothetical protein